MAKNQIVEWNKERCIPREFNMSKEAGHITEELSELLRANSEEEICDALADIIVFATGSIWKLGYNPDIVMEETLLEINDRGGYYDSTINKWKKVAKENTYKANYSKAKETTMTTEEMEARLSALVYILENDFYGPDIIQEVLDEKEQLEKLLYGVPRAKEEESHPLTNPNSPHYNMIDGVEAIKRMEQMYSPDELITWATITAMKYRLRVGNKEQVDALSDIEKIKSYEAYIKYLREF